MGNPDRQQVRQPRCERRRLQHCRVPVMTTAVKDSIVDGTMLEGVCFLDWQCINIGTQANRLFPGAALQHTHYARRPDAGMHVEPEFS